MGVGSIATPKQGTGQGASYPPEAPTGYAPIHSLSFPALYPFQMGQATPTPNNTLGNIGLRGFSKVTRGKPLTKIVIKTQLNNM